MTLTVNNKTQYLEAGIDTMLNFARAIMLTGLLEVVQKN